MWALVEKLEIKSSSSTKSYNLPIVNNRAILPTLFPPLNSCDELVKKYPIICVIQPKTKTVCFYYYHSSLPLGLMIHFCVWGWRKKLKINFQWTNLCLNKQAFCEQKTRDCLLKLNEAFIYIYFWLYQFIYIKLLQYLSI